MHLKLLILAQVVASQVRRFARHSLRDHIRKQDALQTLTRYNLYSTYNFSRYQPRIPVCFKVLRMNLKPRLGHIVFETYSGSLTYNILQKESKPPIAD